jgi:hypothetical protein
MGAVSRRFDALVPLDGGEVRCADTRDRERPENGFDRWSHGQPKSSRLPVC